MASRGYKRPRLIEIDQVDRVFGPAAVKRLAKLAKFPKETNIRRLRVALCSEARSYIERTLGSRTGELAKEIKAFKARAEKNSYKALIGLVIKMSPDARAYFNTLSSRPGFKNIPFPTIELLRNKKTQKEGAQRIRAYCMFYPPVGEFPKKELTPTAERSSEPCKIAVRPEKRLNERKTKRTLGAIYEQAAGIKPPNTASAEAPPPFAKFLQGFFSLVGASGVNTVELINVDLPARRLRKATKLPGHRLNTNP